MLVVGKVGEVIYGRVAIVGECVVLYDGEASAVGKKFDCGRLDEVGVVSVVCEIIKKYTSHIKS